MKSLELLDCTLRDGGYINDWEFGHNVITGTYKRLDAAGTDYIEVGFIDDRRMFDINRSIVPNTECYNEIFKNVTKKHAIPVAMIDYGTCSIDNIGPVDSTFIDGIRVIFKKEKIEKALPFCKAIKEKGYKLFIQAVSITAYSDMELLEYVNKINEIKPFAFSIVDTYGLLDKKKLTNYFNLIDNNLDPEIKIGYHAHNNFQLAFSNAMRFLELVTDHELVVDSTVYGMGKSAGNCPSELISMHMNQYYGKQYDINQYLEILDTDLMTVYKQHYWGYRYNFYISAMQNCHPSYVQFLLDKKTLTVSSINDILNTIPSDKKLLYDEKFIAEAYKTYQYNNIDDAEDIELLSKDISSRVILLLGPGSSIVSKRSDILKYIEEYNPVVISVNFGPTTLPYDYMFISNAKRYSKLADSQNGKALIGKLIITSNITPFDYKPDLKLNYQALTEVENINSDNALLLCLAALISAKAKNVVLAGFDGFTERETDYYEVGFSFAGNEKYNHFSNKIIASGIKALMSRLDIKFLTSSLYEEYL